MRSDGGRPSWKNVVSRPGVWGLLFGLAVVFFNWPLLAAYLDAPLLRAHYALFIVWAVFVACLFVLCRVVGRSGNGDGTGDGEAK